MNDSLVIPLAVVAEDITHILATLHYKNGRWNNVKIDVLIDVLIDVENLQNEVNNRDIPLTVFQG